LVGWNDVLCVGKSGTGTIAAMQSVGSALGAAIGGFTLLIYGYELLGISLGVLAVIGAIIVHLLAVDPITPR
jgi:predicted MFS family arabinose efflux permease